MKKNASTIYQLTLIILSLLYMLPLIIISFFNRPSADDFNYSWRTYQTLQNGGGPLALLKSAFDTSAYYWHNWQGLYTSAFVLSLQPGIFGNPGYALTGLLMLILIAGSTLWASCYIAKHVLGGSTLNGLSLGCLMSFLMIQFMPSCIEGLFWFNGAMNYGLYYALILLLLCSLVKTALAKQVKIVYSIAPILLGFLIEGGNQITALMALILVFFFVIYALVSGKRKAAYLYGLTLLIMVCCFFFNILSPGTKIRQSNFTSPGVIRSILLSIRYGCRFVIAGIKIPLLAVLALAMPVLFKLTSHVRQNTGFRFRFPLLVLACSIGWICAMFCPPIYAMGAPGAGRLHDVVYYFFIFLTFANTFYVCGWIGGLTDQATLSLLFRSKYRWCIFILLLSILFVFSLNSWSVKACRSLLSGETAVYCAEADMRCDMCINGKGTDIILHPFIVKPELLFFSDITEDADDWSNTAMARYYGLRSIRISINE